MTSPTSTTQFVLNIPSDLVPAVTAALCAAGGFDVVSEANAKQAVIDLIVRTVQNVQTAQAMTPPLVIAPITGLS